MSKMKMGPESSAFVKTPYLYNNIKKCFLAPIVEPIMTYYSKNIKGFQIQGFLFHQHLGHTIFKNIRVNRCVSIIL